MEYIVGTIYSTEEHSDRYILTEFDRTPESVSVCLIGTQSGNRWSPPVRVELFGDSTPAITDEQWNVITATAKFRRVYDARPMNQSEYPCGSMYTNVNTDMQYLLSRVHSDSVTATFALVSLATGRTSPTCKEPADAVQDVSNEGWLILTEGCPELFVRIR